MSGVRKTQKYLFHLSILLAAAMILTACGSAEAPLPEQGPQDDPAEEEPAIEPQPVEVAEPEGSQLSSEVEAEEPVAEQEPDAAGGAVERPAWHSIALTDVRSGETYTLTDLEGQVVLLETMAVWCPACEIQQREINAALGQLGEGFVAVSLDVDPSESAEILASHAARLGLGWRFSLSGAELALELQNEYGPQVLTPPATPVLIIGPDGRTELTPFGIKGADSLVSAAQAMLP